MGNDKDVFSGGTSGEAGCKRALSFSFVKELTGLRTKCKAKQSPDRY